jgi:hypothetical protein
VLCHDSIGRPRHQREAVLRMLCTMKREIVIALEPHEQQRG